MEITLTKENFEKEVIDNKEPILVDFWAEWCGPCGMLAPILSEIADEGMVRVGKLNVDDEMELATKYGIEAIPTVMLFKDGALAKKSIGLVSKEELLAML